MEEIKSTYGTLLIGDISELFQYTVEAINMTAQINPHPLIGLTGGSTPKAFYIWAAQAMPFTKETIQRTLWSTSDERHVPLSSEESNFGCAMRGMFKQLGIAEENQRPWPVDKDAHEAAELFNATWAEEGRDEAFDLCFLGMGDDCHTASLFPGSELIKSDPVSLFAAIEVPEKGWRLTVTPRGLRTCEKTLITVTGEGKAKALKAVLEGEYDPQNKPAQLLKDCAEKTTWLIDRDAAAKLTI